MEILNVNISLHESTPVPPLFYTPDQQLVYEFDMPVELQCKHLIGEMTYKTGASISLLNQGEPTQKCAIRGCKRQIDGVLLLIRTRFPFARYPELTLNQTNVIHIQSELPLKGDSNVIISSILEPNRVFVQQVNNPFFHLLPRLNDCMDLCYNTFPSLGLPEPIQPGIICAAPVSNHWFRTVVVNVIPPAAPSDQNKKEEQLVVRFVDYGGYACIPASSLRMIRQDFLTLPFQAVECYLANVAPHSIEMGWTNKEFEELAILTSNQTLQAQIVAQSPDGVPLILLYHSNETSQSVAKRQLVNSGVGKWIDVPSVCPQTKQSSN